MKMRVDETLRSYASRYWELYNEIGRGNEKIATGTFKMGLPKDSELRESLTKRPLEDMRQLMRRIEEYKHLEDDRLQSKGKAPLLNCSRQGIFPSRPRKDLRMQEPEAQMEEVNVAFKEPIHKIVDRIKNETFFKWPNKMGGDPSRKNQNLYCTYHRDKGHTTEQCWVLKEHLGQLVKAGYLKEFVVDSRNQGAEQGAFRKGNPLPPPLGVIEVIHAAPKGSKITKRGVLTVAPARDCLGKQKPEKKMRIDQEPIAFDADKWFLNEKSDGRPRKRGQHNVPKLIQRA